MLGNQLHPNHLITARDLNYIPPTLFQKGYDLACEVHRLLNGYIEHLRAKKQAAD